MNLDKEVEVISKIVAVLEEAEVSKEFDLPRILEYIVDRYDFSSKLGRKRTLERIVYQLNKIDDQGLEESL